MRAPLTFHPQGIHHGPHPKAFEAANDKTYTDEYAVMVDARYPLESTAWFEEKRKSRLLEKLDVI